MVTQYNWEEEIIWNGEDIKYKQKRRQLAVGWVPSSFKPTVQVLSQLFSPFAAAVEPSPKPMTRNEDDT